MVQFLDGNNKETNFKPKWFQLFDIGPTLQVTKKRDCNIYDS